MTRNKPNPDSEPRNEGGITDEELTALALAADPKMVLSADAVPLNLNTVQFAGALPQWYMPAATAGGSSRWRLPVIGIIIAAFLIIDGLGLCNTFGLLSFA